MARVTVRAMTYCLLLQCRANAAWWGGECVGGLSQCVWLGAKESDRPQLFTGFWLGFLVEIAQSEQKALSVGATAATGSRMNIRASQCARAHSTLMLTAAAAVPDKRAALRGKALRKIVKKMALESVS